MTITREESSLLDKRDELTENETATVDETMRELNNIMKLNDLKPAGDDREARVEAALIRFMFECRKGG